MKSYETTTLTSMAQLLIKDSYARVVCNIDDIKVRLDVQRDCRRIQSRVEKEGLSFLTIALPEFAVGIEAGLRNGRLNPLHFRAFKKTSKASRIPCLFKGITKEIFDEKGVLHAKPDIQAIRGIRQITKAFKKILVDCQPNKVDRAYEKYLECEAKLDEPLRVEDTNKFHTVCRLLWPYVLRDFPSIHNLVPKHGPGSTAEGIFGNNKYSFVVNEWYERLEPYFPLYDFAYPSSNARDGGRWVAESPAKISPEELVTNFFTLVPEEQETPVKVIHVPKTLKAPRIIALEPVCMQYAQQAVARSLVKLLENDRFVGGQINFTDQKINQKLAIMGSSTEALATIDMSSASDLVPNSLAMAMFASRQDLLGAIQACRSTRAQLPDGRNIIGLRKFASMGSALCFPVEAMYFYTICVIALLENLGLPFTRPSVEKVSKMVYVYGDDIILPSASTQYAIETLHKYYCKVNTEKSFWTGKFRESCGTDAYAGEVVTPSYIRRVCPRGRTQASELVSYVSLRNQLYKAGYLLTAEFIKNLIEKILGRLPIISDGSNNKIAELDRSDEVVSISTCLGWVSFEEHVTVRKLSVGTQSPLVKGYVPACRSHVNRIEGWPALMKCLLALNDRRSTIVETSKDHLTRSVRRGTLYLKYRWSPVTM